MKKHLLFIHGYGSDRNSRKYHDLKNHFEQTYDCKCLEWTTESDMKPLLEEAAENYKNSNEIVIIGDSTGANFAWQLREMRNTSTDKLILLSPLLDISMRLRDIEFPEYFAKQLAKISHPENALIIFSPKDEVLSMENLVNGEFINCEILKVNDTHRLEDFKNYLGNIENFIAQEL